MPVALEFKGWAVEPTTDEAYALFEGSDGVTRFVRKSDLAAIDELEDSAPVG